MSENNYGAPMLKSALDISVDVTKNHVTRHYPVIHGNTSVPDAVQKLTESFPYSIQSSTDYLSKGKIPALFIPLLTELGKANGDRC